MKRTLVVLAFYAALCAVVLLLAGALPALPAHSGIGTAPAHLAAAQPVSLASAAAATTIGSKPPCFDFCSRALCAPGTTCGPNPKTGACGCWPDDVFPTNPSNPSTDPSSGL